MIAPEREWRDKQQPLRCSSHQLRGQNMQLLIIETHLQLWHKITKYFDGHWSRIGVLEPLGAGVWLQYSCAFTNRLPPVIRKDARPLRPFPCKICWIVSTERGENRKIIDQNAKTVIYILFDKHEEDSKHTKPMAV